MGCPHSRGGRTSFTYSVPINRLEDVFGESQTYRDPAVKDKLTHTMNEDPSVLTLQDAYLRQFKKYANEDFLGTRQALPDGNFGPYKFRTYQEVQDIATKLGSGIINLGLTTTVSDFRDIPVDFLIIWSRNREELMITDADVVPTSSWLRRTT